MTDNLHIKDPSKPTHIDMAFRRQPDWIHPDLIESKDPIKGRQLRVSALIPKNTCLLIDRAYAIIPVVDHPATNDDLICSNLICSRRASSSAGRCSCPNGCIEDVAWCSDGCRNTDKARHEFECKWLKRYAPVIRAKWDEYTFGMLWLIVRLLATRSASIAMDGDIAQKTTSSISQKDWAGVQSLCGSTDTWPHEQVRSWTILVKKYLQNSPLLPHGMSTDRILHLICQEEANSFGLYPCETGVFPPPNPSTDRGEQFAAAVYTTAALANHSCYPNIIHKPDDQGRMVLTAARDILLGEECCITYFDLTVHIDLCSRREHLRKSFRFKCQCERCISEDSVDMTSEWDPMPVFDE
ncbi:hypothetical protein N7495_003177 [Penicillium taxi]|uniref:uncharacterized protein n=1 Tax=Penicillium taxi TaxID=168475 RepID=UPI002544E3B6|nr:uncharacterized protein N7495_003177 [Penicillium taxi]KAJ5902649.1 hypothetical protein N7495_003177 [Penicillium taxi]